MIRSPGHLAVHRHRVAALRDYPFVCVLQAPAAEGAERVVCPMVAENLRGPTTPRVELQGKSYAVLLRQMRWLPLRALGEPAGTAEPARADIARGIDLLFFGI